MENESGLRFNNTGVEGHLNNNIIIKLFRSVFWVSWVVLFQKMSVQAYGEESLPVLMGENIFMLIFLF